MFYSNLEFQSLTCFVVHFLTLWGLHSRPSALIRLAQGVKGGRYKNTIKKLTPVLTTVIIIKGLSFGVWVPTRNQKKKKKNAVFNNVTFQ